MIKIDNLHKQYGDNQVLKGISISINSGEVVSIIGPSGSGKSTLLSLLTGILSPTEGTVSINGTDINQLTSNQRDRFRADNIGYIFQQFNLLPYLSVIDNVILPYQFSSKKELSKQDLIKNTYFQSNKNAPLYPHKEYAELIL